MRWLFPSWFWLQALPLLILVASALSRRIYLRRLKRYGDSRLLGLTRSTGWANGKILLQALGVAFISAIPSGPVRKVNDAPSIEFLLDHLPSSGSFREAEREWDRWCHAIDLFSGQVSRTRFSVYQQGNPPKLLVPPTFDSGGLLLILEGALPLDVKRDDPGPSHILPPVDGLNKSHGLVVVTSRGREEIMRLWSSGLHPGDKTLFLSVNPEGAAVDCGMPDENGDWRWDSPTEFVPAFLSGIENSARFPLSLWRRASLVQLFAFAGFVLLLAEFVIPLLKAMISRT